MNQYQICEKLSQFAMQAILFEVSTTPKPGLVDRMNAGAHQDMDFFTFMSSSAAIAHFFYECSYHTYVYLEDNEKNGLGNIDYPGLFTILRNLGKKAETSMFEATKGVNTHKGLIFSMAIITSAATILHFKQMQKKLDIEELSEEIKCIVKGICDHDFKQIASKIHLTAGERLYLDHQIKGIRGEAEMGFPHVKNIGYPIIKDLVNQNKYSMNDIFIHVLLHLMAKTIDTNILSRTDMKTLEEVQALAQNAIELGGGLTDEGKQYIQELDQMFIQRHISPGGSADLLAVSILFYWLVDINIIY